MHHYSNATFSKHNQATKLIYPCRKITIPLTFRHPYKLEIELPLRSLCNSDFSKKITFSVPEVKIVHLLCHKNKYSIQSSQKYPKKCLEKFTTQFYFNHLPLTPQQQILNAISFGCWRKLSLSNNYSFYWQPSAFELYKTAYLINPQIQAKTIYSCHPSENKVSLILSSQTTSELKMLT